MSDVVVSWLPICSWGERDIGCSYVLTYLGGFLPDRGAMIQKLPLFPLHTVLFPSMPLTLHIFEERYRLMIGRCLEQKLPFGVVLIREGGETNTDTIPYLVGTVAQISDSVRLDDGRYYLVALGQRRFRIQYIAQRQPYLVGSISYLSEESSSTDIAQADELRALYRRYWEALAIATGYHHAVEALPDQVIELTYWMAHRLQVDTVHKQRWLEADVSTRLREMGAAIRAELTLLPDASGPRAHLFGEGDRSWPPTGSWN